MIDKTTGLDRVSWATHLIGTPMTLRSFHN
jgi:hypothetical protein